MIRKAVVLLLLSSTLAFSGSTGKITGTVVDGRTKEKLAAVNVIIEGTTLGAATNPDGYYVILNIPPGQYRLRASLIGYSPATVVDVRVNIDQTTNIDIDLTEATVATQEVVVVAQRPVVQKDVSNSVTNLNVDEIRNLPITQVSSVIGLQAGVQGLVVRGGGSDQTAFMVDGLTLRDERNNSPYTSISLLAVQELQIQTGGFNAEYGNVRSGQINVVTKEGSTAEYRIGFLTRYRPATRKYFGDPPNSSNAYFIRPYMDDAVCWTGTQSGAWDIYDQRQYPRFKGWNTIVSELLKDNDPTNDLTPEAARKLWLWQHRKDLDARRPDYDVDAALSGPVPYVGKMLGGLRFYASYRQTFSQYIVPEATDGLTDWSASVKVTSDVGPGMKLMGEYLDGKVSGTSVYRDGTYGVFSTPAGLANSLSNRNFIDARMFGTDYWPVSDAYRTILGVKFTHLLTASTFYEVSFQQFRSRYDTYSSRNRDTTRFKLFGNSYYADESPFGWADNPPIIGGIDGMLMGYTGSRDSSRIITSTLRADFATQLDKYNQIKTGIEFVLSASHTDYGSVDARLPDGNTLYKWDRTPVRFAAYLQDKLEFEGMIANIGLRFELSHAGGDWYVWKPYDPAFSRENVSRLDQILSKQPTTTLTSVSPRLGIAFPITEYAKLFFNYGHFRSMPQPENLFLLEYRVSTGDLNHIANPNLLLPKTVAYELGYEHSIAEQFLIRASAYYKDVTNERNDVLYVGSDSKYYTPAANLYEDIRGFELTLERNRGSWVRGFLNYTYMVSTYGYFGKREYDESFTEQQKTDQEAILSVKPIPQPYARANVDFLTPSQLGPAMFGGFYPLGDWRLNVLASWNAGQYITWPRSSTTLQNNLQWRPSWGCDVRISKALRIGPVDAELFVDIYNVLNIKQMTNYNGVPLGLDLITDYDDYMKSLHLPEGDFLAYDQIPGDDRPGDYRKNGVEFQPMEFSKDIMSQSNPNARAIYWDLKTRSYYQYVNGQWQLADQKKVDQVLRDKAYIDMPNQTYFTFLNPRSYYFGIRFSFGL